MSTVRTYTINVTSMVEIQILNKLEIEKIVSDSIKMIIEKITRFKNHLSSCSYDFVNNCLIVYDELNIVNDIEDLLKTYGMMTRKVISQKGGSLYLISDPLLEILRILNYNPYELLKNELSFDNSIHTLIKDEDVFEKLISKEGSMLIKNIRLKELIDKAKSNEKMTIKKTDLIRVEERDGYTQSQKVVSTTSLENEYKIALKDLNGFIGEIDKSHKMNIVNGTTKSLELKAKKMGYSVEKKIVEDKVQLVLVRSR